MRRMRRCTCGGGTMALAIFLPRRFSLRIFPAPSLSLCLMRRPAAHWCSKGSAAIMLPRRSLRTLVAARGNAKVDSGAFVWPWEILSRKIDDFVGAGEEMSCNDMAPPTPRGIFSERGNTYEDSGACICPCEIFSRSMEAFVGAGEFIGRAGVICRFPLLFADAVADRIGDSASSRGARSSPSPTPSTRTVRL